MKILKPLSLFLAFALLSSSASASVLGNTYINGYSATIGTETEFFNNTYLSDQSGVGLQTENYITYSPNPDTTPLFGYGEKLYGNLTKTKDIADRLLENDEDIIAGINADYFSFQTGVPMSNLIENGEIISKDGTATYGFGFGEDGEAFTGECYIEATLTRADGRTMNIECINKYRQPYSMYLLNSKFSNETHGTTLGLDIIIDAETDSLKIGETIKGTVSYAQCYEGSIAIPEGALVLTLDVNAPQFNEIADIAVGEEIEISISAPTEPRWENAIIGMGSTGEYILSGGVVTPNLPAGAHPRTAFGIKANGDVIFYTIDGRQEGYSYGVKLSTLAERMKELGCVEAINLDGGGSTTIVGRLPGDEGVSVLNTPSDKGGRKVSTNIFLKNNLEKTGKVSNLMIYPARVPYIMNGASTTFTAKASDTAYYAMDVSDKVSFSIEGGAQSTITKRGYFTASDTGKVTVSAEYKNMTATRDVYCVKSPDDILIKDDSGKTIDTLKIKRNGEMNLSAWPFYNHNEVISEDDCFTWETSGNIGTIDKDGIFTASNSIGASGTITVSAGETSREIKVYVLPDGNESEELLYSTLDAQIEGDTLLGTISNEYNLEVQKDNLSITADGAELYVEYENGEFTAPLPENTNKIRIVAINDLGYTSVLSLTHNEDFVYENPFVDTTTNWARDILSYMYNKGLVKGENSATGLIYNPQKEMSRSEFAVLICNYLGVDLAKYENISLPYTDEAEIPLWAKNQFKALYSLNILRGRDAGDGTFYADPKTGISRAEAFTIIARLLPKGLKKVEITGTDKNQIPTWAEDGFMTLMADGTVKGYEDGSLKPLNKLTKAEAAKLLYSLY
ncbi:MAG: phosphodiester glycosidase family protein [Clostridia bacterium]|nr:phosphodiester glycosidase family protein [Clostridia bacterium]